MNNLGFSCGVRTPSKGSGFLEEATFQPPALAIVAHSKLISADGRGAHGMGEKWLLHSFCIMSSAEFVAGVHSPAEEEEERPTLWVVAHSKMNSANAAVCPQWASDT